MRELFRDLYNTIRPHEAIGFLTPMAVHLAQPNLSEQKCPRNLTRDSPVPVRIQLVPRLGFDQREVRRRSFADPEHVRRGIPLRGEPRRPFDGIARGDRIHLRWERFDHVLGPEAGKLREVDDRQAFLGGRWVGGSGLGVWLVGRVDPACAGLGDILSTSGKR